MIIVEPPYPVRQQELISDSVVKKEDKKLFEKYKAPRGKGKINKDWS